MEEDWKRERKEWLEGGKRMSFKRNVKRRDDNEEKRRTDSGIEDTVGPMHQDGSRFFLSGPNPL